MVDIKYSNTPKSVFMLDIDGALDESTVNEIMALPDKEGEDAVEQQNREISSVADYVLKQFRRSEDHRRQDETRWLTAYRNYRGEYQAYTDTEKSRTFVKITKTKVLAAYAQITDVLFAGNKFPIGIEPSPEVDGVAEAVYFDPKEPKPQGDQSEPQSTSPRSSAIARQDILDMVGPYKDQLERVKDSLKEGYGSTPTSVTFEPAVQAAKNMEKRIHDQLEEANANASVRDFTFELCLFGTGAFKGPTVIAKEYPRWNEDGVYEPIFKDTADVNAVSIWSAYPDPDARTIQESEYFIERHKFSRTDLRNLKKRPYFRAESIDACIKQGPNYTEKYWESELRDNNTVTNIDRFEVLEYWGFIDKEIAEEHGIGIPDILKDQDQIQVQVWMCGDYILRLVLNPFNPARIPYYICPYEHNPYSMFGIGVAENMEDTQTLMNGFMRIIVDNAAMSSNVIFEIDETSMVAGQDMKLYPGKIFRRQAGAPGQAIFSTKVQNVTQETLLVFDKARQLADEATGIPSYSHGQGGIQGIGRTASGMSMLMGAAAQNIKAVVRNIDDYFLSPLGKSMFAWNMQFSFDKKFLGDVEVVSKGTESLMRNEIRSQKILQALQVTANPMDAPYVKRDYLLRELFGSLDIDPDKAVNDPREAAIQAVVMGEMKKKMGEDPNAPPGGNPTGAPAPSDPTGNGGGNIAPGAAPEPGAAGFASNGGTGGSSAPTDGQPMQ